MDGWARLFLNRYRCWDILLGFIACVLWEQLAGEGLTSVLGLPKMPVLFGLLTIFKVLAGVVNL
jgi:hypothetical protein